MMLSKNYIGRLGGTIFVDALRPSRESDCWLFDSSCRLFTLPGWLDDLNEFAAKLDLKPAWLLHGQMPHYALTATRRGRAIGHGAMEVNRAQFVDAVRLWRVSNEKSRVASLKGQEGQAEGLIRNPRREREIIPLSNEEVHAEVEKLRSQMFGGKAVS